MNRLKTLRKEYKEKLTQEELAKRIGVTKLTVSNWETGKHAITPENARLLADFFKVPISYLLGFSDIPYSNARDVIFERQDGTLDMFSFTPLEQSSEDFDKEYLNSLIKETIKNFEPSRLDLANKILSNISNLDINKVHYIEQLLKSVGKLDGRAIQTLNQLIKELSQKK